MLNCTRISTPTGLAQSMENLTKIQIETGITVNASGSCHLTCYGNRLIATAIGPQMMSSNSNTQIESDDESRVRCEIRFPRHYGLGHLPSSSSNDYQITDEEKQLACLLKDAVTSSIRLELYPKCTISIAIAILECQEHEMIPMCINAATIALVDSGIELRDLALASSVKTSTGSVFVLAEMFMLQETTLLLAESRSGYKAELIDENKTAIDNKDGSNSDNRIKVPRSIEGLHWEELASWINECRVKSAKFRRVLDSHMYEKVQSIAPRLV